MGRRRWAVRGHLVRVADYRYGTMRFGEQEAGAHMRVKGASLL